MLYKKRLMIDINDYAGTPYCRVEMFAGRGACYPLVSHDEYADRTNRQTDGRTPTRYITLSACII